MFDADFIGFANNCQMIDYIFTMEKSINVKIKEKKTHREKNFSINTHVYTYCLQQINGSGLKFA